MGSALSQSVAKPSRKRWADDPRKLFDARFSNLIDRAEMPQKSPRADLANPLDFSKLGLHPLFSHQPALIAMRETMRLVANAHEEEHLLRRRRQHDGIHSIADVEALWFVVMRFRQSNGVDVFNLQVFHCYGGRSELPFASVDDEKVRQLTFRNTCLQPAGDGLIEAREIVASMLFRYSESSIARRIHHAVSHRDLRGHDRIPSEMRDIEAFDIPRHLR